MPESQSDMVPNYSRIEIYAAATKLDFYRSSEPMDGITISVVSKIV